MNKKYLSGFLFLALFGMGYWTAIYHSTESGDFASQAPHTKVDVPKDLLQGAKEFLAFVSNPQGFTYENCATSLKEIYSDFYKTNPEHFDHQNMRNSYKEIIHTIFQARAALRERLKSFPIPDSPAEKPDLAEDACISRARDIFRLGRYLEDYLGEMYLGVKPYEEGKDPVAFGTFTGEEPWLLKTSNTSEINIRSGDVIISRGNAYTSAAIARITEIDSQFSHLAFIYIEGDDGSGKTYKLRDALDMPNVLVMEAHIEIGSTVRQIRQYLNDGNARNVLFRYSDPKVAHLAAKATHQFIMDYREQAYKHRYAHPTELMLPKDHPDFSVPYGFQMDMNSTKQVFCSEVASLGYSTQKVFLPRHASTLAPPTENDLVKVLGIVVKKTFAPGDVEVDPRFEMLAEWRDYRKMRSIRIKDATLVAMYDWMKQYQYKLHSEIFVKLGAEAFSLARHLDFPKIEINGKVYFDVTKKLPKNMTAKMAATVETLNRTADVLLLKLESEEAKYQKTHQGFLLTLPQMLAQLEGYRSQDASTYEHGEKAEFHGLFRPDTLKNK